MDKNKNFSVLMSFVRYCTKHPHERFWQALRNWSDFEFINGVRKGKEVDTFYFEGKDK